MCGSECSCQLRRLLVALLAFDGDASRFATRDAFAAYNGTAPIEVSTGNRKIHRLSRRGNRRLNHAIHMSAVTQIRHRNSDGRVYYDRKIAEGKSSKEALRVLKGRISDTIFARLLADARRVANAAAAGSGGRVGNDSDSSVAGSHPNTSSSDKPLPSPNQRYDAHPTAANRARPRHQSRKFEKPLDTKRTRQLRVQAQLRNVAGHADEGSVPSAAAVSHALPPVPDRLVRSGQSKETYRAAIRKSVGVTDSERSSARRRASSPLPEDVEANLMEAKMERPWADTWWENGTEDFDRAVLIRMTFAQAKTITDACKSDAPESIADWCYEQYSRDWRLSWLPDARTSVGHHICAVAGRFLGEFPSDTGSMRISLARAMTRRIALTYLTGLALLGVGIVAGATFSSTIGAVASLSGVLLIIVIHNIAGRRVFGSLAVLLSPTIALRFQGQLYTYGIRVAWKTATQRHGPGAAP